MTIQTYKSNRTQTYLKEPPKQASIPCYAAHFQLRDLIISPVPGKVALANGRSIDGVSFPSAAARGGAWSPNPLVNTTHLFNLPFVPVCFSYGCGLVALGGQASELSIRTLQQQAQPSPANGGQTSSGWDKANFSIGDNINNSVAILPQPGSSQWTGGATATDHSAPQPTEARMILSNNDQSIGIWDIYPQQSAFDHHTPLEAEQSEDVCPITLQKRASLRPADTAINYCAVSKDGRFMAAVGDTNQVYLYSCPRNPNEADRGYKLIHTAQASEDAIFSADWSRDNATCAVASQDGLVSLFDVRYLKSCNHQNSRLNAPPSVVTQFSTQRSATMRGTHRMRLFSSARPECITGAARSVKFSPGCTTELLAFTEQSGYFHLVDARSLDPGSHKTCQLPRSSGPTSSSARAGAAGVATEEEEWRDLLSSTGGREHMSGLLHRARAPRRREQPRPPSTGSDWFMSEQLQDEETNREDASDMFLSSSSRPCVGEETDDAPQRGQSLHSFFFGQDNRIPSPRRSSSFFSTAASSRPDWSGLTRDTLLSTSGGNSSSPQLEPDGSLTLAGFGARSRTIADILARQSPGTSGGVSTIVPDEVESAFGNLLSTPSWADISAHDPFSISGMSWDPYGELLYIATSSATYEYRIDLCGRNSLPEATLV